MRAHNPISYQVLFAALLCGVSTAHAQTTTRLYATAAPLVPEWQNESRCLGDPGCDPCSCNDSQYASNAIGSGRLQITNFEDFGLPAGHRITRVRFNVMGRYDSGFAGHIRAHVRHPEFGEVTRDTPPFTSTLNCDYQFQSPANDITSLLDWNANPARINQLELDIQRVATPSAHGPLRVKAVRIVVDWCPDFDGDAACNDDDPDDDNDGVADGQDQFPLDRFRCRDADADTCDDCVSGSSNPGNDGADTDSDGRCNAGDTDDDNDGVADGQDQFPLDRFRCRDADADTCDDCVSGSSNPGNDGADTDSDGRCNAGDADDDNDGVADGQDQFPLDRFRCRDTDNDTCDDCISGAANPNNDGADADFDGQCNAGDPDDDNDGVPDGQDQFPLNRFRCRDLDADGCDDCTFGSANPANDGLDTDGDGRCDASDDDIDGDGVLNPADSDPLFATICSDSDGDGCDDCSSGVFNPLQDGVDGDGDGRCDPPPLLLGAVVQLPTGAAPEGVTIATSPGDAEAVIAVSNRGNGTVSIVRVAADGTPRVSQTLQVGGSSNSSPNAISAGTEAPHIRVVTLLVVTNDGVHRFSGFGGSFNPIPLPPIPGAFRYASRTNVNPNCPEGRSDDMLGESAGNLQARLGDGSGSTCDTGKGAPGEHLDTVLFESLGPNFTETPYHLFFVDGQNSTGRVYRGTDSVSSCSQGYNYIWNGWVQQQDLVFDKAPGSVDGIEPTATNPQPRLLVAHPQDAMVSVYDPPWTAPALRFQTGSTPISAQSVDFNNDGKPDLSTTGLAARALFMFLGSGETGFRPYAKFDYNEIPSKHAFGDANLDSRKDVMVVFSSISQLRIYLNNTAGNLLDCNENGVWDRWDILSESSQDADSDGIPDECQATFPLGDTNCNAFVEIGDIGPFILALTNPAQYVVQYPNCNIQNADTNQDGFVNVGDIGSFVQLLTGG